MGYLTRGHVIVLGIVGLVVVVALVHLSTSNEHVQEEISKLAAQVLKQTTKRGPVDIKVDTLAPCGAVCSYDGKVDKDKSSAIYPQLTKNINCVNIMRRMAFRHHNITRPPPRKVPSALVNAYTQNGKVKLAAPWYFDNVKNDPRHQTTFNKTDMDKLIGKVLDHVNINSYHDGNCAMDLVKKYSKKIANRKIAVIGTQRPWLEAMMLANGAKHVTTLEYNKLVYGIPEMSFYNPYSYAEMYLRGETKPFDIIATFSSLEHSGLGRYGDPINPYGDLEAMAQMWCMLKPGATAFIGVPGKSTGGTSIQWNAHRIYGPDRLQHLTANFDIVEAEQCKDGHIILVGTKS